MDTKELLKEIYNFRVKRYDLEIEQAKLMKKPMKYHKPSGREKALYNWFISNGYSCRIANMVIDDKVSIAMELGMVIEPYCLDRRYSRAIRVQVALAQSTNYLYYYFVKGQSK